MTNPIKIPSSVKIADGMSIDHRSPAYKLGLAQLREWHARCAAKRAGIKRKEVNTSTVRASKRRKSEEVRNGCAEGAL